MNTDWFAVACAITTLPTGVDPETLIGTAEKPVPNLEMPKCSN